MTAPSIANVIQGGQTLYSAEEVMKGQQTWQTTGGQQLGSLWGHGSYVAPDWSADWLHREAVALQNILAQKIYHRDFSVLSQAEQAAVNADLRQEMRTNTYDATTNSLTVSPERAQAIAEVTKHYTALFGDDPSMNKLREQYAMGIICCLTLLIKKR